MGARVQWNIPGGPGFLGAAPMVIQLDGQVDITLYWPGDVQNQIIYGSFRGFLPNHGNRKVCCSFIPEIMVSRVLTVVKVLGEYIILPSKDAPIRYYFEFADDGYSSDQYMMPLVDLIQVFGSIGMNIVTSLFANFPLPGE